MFASTAQMHEATAQWQKLMVDSWSQWTAKTVSSESFAAASGAYMDWALSTQKVMTEMSGQVLETLDLPRRSDLARLAAQVQSVESRLLDQDDSNADIRELLLALNSKIDKLTATAHAPVATNSDDLNGSIAPATQAKAPRKGSKKGAI